MGDLTKNFSRKEFACRCCGECEIDPGLPSALQKLRELVSPIIVLSGYRCPKHNREIGGEQNSQHLLGKAADITVPGHTLQEIVQAAEQITDFWIGGIGVYPEQNFVHLDIRGKKARWGKLHGSSVSIDAALNHICHAGGGPGKEPKKES